MRHLHVTNEAIVPVLNVTRLKAIKGSPFSNEQASGQSSLQADDEDRRSDAAKSDGEEERK